MASVRKVIRIKRTNGGETKVVEIPMVNGQNLHSNHESIKPENNLKTQLEKTIGIDVPVPDPTPVTLPFISKPIVPLPFKPKITMENLKDWVQEVGTSRSPSSSISCLKRKIIEEMPSTVVQEPPAESPPTKISDLNNVIKEITMKSPGKTPKVVRIVKLDKNEKTGKSVIKIVKPPSDKNTILDPTNGPSTSNHFDPPPLKGETHHQFCYFCVKCQKRFTKINGTHLPLHGEERKIWFERLALPMNETTSKFALICSDHFLETDLFVNKNGEKRVVDKAMPKIVKVKPQMIDRKKYPRLGCVKCRKRFDLVNGACFPKRDAEIQEWKNLLDLADNVKVNFKSVVCADHFHEKDMFISKNGEKRVIPNAFPKEHRKSDDTKPEKAKKAPKLKVTLQNKKNLANFDDSIHDEQMSESDRAKMMSIKNARSYFRLLPKYRAYGEPIVSTSIIKPEPASDHEDEVDKVARQQEVKILVKKKPRLDKSPIKAVKNDALLSKIKEEPLDFDERVDEAFVVESKRLEEQNLIKVKPEPLDTPLEPMETSDFPLFPLEPFLETLPEPELDEEPRLLEVTQEEDTDDEEDPNPEKISTLVHSLFASPLKKPKPGSSKENFARRSRGYFAVLPQNFKATIIELLPDCIKEPIESNDSLDAFKFAGIMPSSKDENHYYCSACGQDIKFSPIFPIQGVTAHLRSETHKQMFRLYEKCYAKMKCTQGFRGIQSSSRGDSFVYCTFCLKHISIGQTPASREFLLTSHVMLRNHFEIFLTTSKIAKKNVAKIGLTLNLKEKERKQKTDADDVDFKEEYSGNYVGIMPSSRGPKFFHCKLCRVDLTLEKIGEHAIYVHTKKPRHQKALKIYLKNIEWMNRRKNSGES